MSDDTFSLTVLDGINAIAQNVRFDHEGPCRVTIHPGVVVVENVHGRPIMYLNECELESLFGLAGAPRNDDHDGSGMSGPVGGDRGSEGV